MEIGHDGSESATGFVRVLYGGCYPSSYVFAFGSVDSGYFKNLVARQNSWEGLMIELRL